MPEIKGQTFDRAISITLEAARGEGAERVYPASLSSTQPVKRFFGVEVLSHDDGAVNMERAGRGLPLLFNHDMDAPIGRVGDIRVDGDKLRGVLRFSPNSERGPRVQADVDAGFLGDVSIRYSIDEYQTVADERGNDTITVTRWTPLEASIVTVPADSSVGIGRSIKETIDMTTETTGTKPEQSGDGTVNVVAFQQARATAAAEGERAGAERERARVADIEAVFAPFAARGADVAALKTECIRIGSSADQSRAALLSMIAGTPGATPSGTRQHADDEGAGSGRRDVRIEAGATEREKALGGMERALILKSDAMLATTHDARRTAEKELAGNEFARLSLADMAREWCVLHGLSVRGKNSHDIVRLALGEGRRAVGLGTVDFPGLMANVASKSLLAGWEEAQTTWRQWCRVGSVPDFKRANRTGLSGADLLDKVPENMEYKRGDLSDRTEYMTAYTFGKLFAFTRQAIINDDLQALSATPRKLGRAADLTVNKEVVDLLCSASGVGPTLNQDSTALFHANHNNYTATSGAPSVANIEVGRNALARQTDPNNGMPLNIQPKYLLVPSALVTTAKVLVASEKDPLGTASATGGATTPNPFYNALTVIGEPYLDDSSHTNGTVAWYLLGDQNMHDTMEVGFVQGASAPYLESRDGWTVDGVEYKVRLDFGVSALDYRAMYRKKGA